MKTDTSLGNLSNSNEKSGIIIDLRPFYEADRVREMNLELSSDVDFVTGCVFVGTLKSMAGLIKLEGTATANVKTECAKCLAEIERQLEVPVKHYLVRELNDEQDDDEYILVEDDLLRLDELLNEDLVLSMPLRFLCRPDCKGLCTQCGKNLNEGACSCKRQIDPRLQALADLL